MAKKRKRRKVKKNSFIVLFILILIIIVGIVYFYTHTSKYLFFKGVENSYNNLVSIYDDFSNIYFYDGETYHIETVTTVDIKTDEGKNNLTITGDIYAAGSVNYYDLNLESEDEYQLTLINTDNKLYYSVDNSKYYYTDSNTSFDEEELSDVLTLLTKSLKNNVSSSNFDKERETITINDKDYNSKKITLSLTNSAYLNTLIDFYNELISSDELLSYYLVFTDYDDVDTLKEELESDIEIYQYNLDNLEEDNIVFNYSVYYYRGEVIKNYISLDSDTSYGLTFTYLDNYIAFGYQEDDSSSYISISDNKVEGDLSGILKLSGTYSDDKIEITLVDYDGNSLGSINYSIDGSSYDLELSIVLELISIDITSNNEVDDNNVPDYDLSNSSSLSEIDDDTLDKLNDALDVLKILE